MGSALTAGDEFSFSGSLYAVWPCSLGMQALFWGDIKMFLFGGKFEASINVFTTYFCGVQAGSLTLHVSATPQHCFAQHETVVSHGKPTQLIPRH
jgi:hypothetical protein